MSVEYETVLSFLGLCRRSVTISNKFDYDLAMSYRRIVDKSADVKDIIKLIEKARVDNPALFEEEDRKYFKKKSSPSYESSDLSDYDVPPPTVSRKKRKKRKQLKRGSSAPFIGPIPKHSKHANLTDYKTDGGFTENQLSHTERSCAPVISAKRGNFFTSGPKDETYEGKPQNVRENVEYIMGLLKKDADDGFFTGRKQESRVENWVESTVNHTPISRSTSIEKFLENPSEVHELLNVAIPEAKSAESPF